MRHNRHNRHERHNRHNRHDRHDRHDRSHRVPLMSDTSRTAIAPEYDRTAQELLRRLASLVPLDGSRRVVIGVAGESGSGKSVTAVALVRALEAAGIPAMALHQDDYFLRPPRVNHAHRERDIGAVGPHEVNLALLAQHVADFRAANQDVALPVCDYATDSFRTRTVSFAPFASLVVEGTYVLMLDDGVLDARIFLEATHEDTAERRRARARDIDAPFVQQVLAIEHEIIARQAAHADVILDRDFQIRT